MQIPALALEGKMQMRCLSVRGLFRLTFVITLLLVSLSELRAGATTAPTDPDLKAAQAKVRSIFRAELAAARTTDQKLELARKLARIGSEEKEAASAYALMLMARDLASESGNLEPAWQVVSAIADRFALDSLKMRGDVAMTTARSAAAQDKAALIEPLQKLVIEAGKQERYDVARPVAEQLAALARAQAGAEPARFYASQAAELRDVEAQYSASRSAMERLKLNAADSEASLTLGRYLCFYREDWFAGRGHLAAGADKALADLATRELAGTISPNSLVALADDWWAYSEKQPSFARRSIQRHAAEFYQLAAARLSGLEKDRAEKRIALALPERDLDAPDAPAGMRLIEVNVRPDGTGTVTVDSRPESLQLPPAPAPGITQGYQLLHCKTATVERQEGGDWYLIRDLRNDLDLSEIRNFMCAQQGRHDRANGQFILPVNSPKDGKKPGFSVGRNFWAPVQARLYLQHTGNSKVTVGICPDRPLELVMDGASGRVELRGSRKLGTILEFIHREGTVDRRDFASEPQSRVSFEVAHYSEAESPGLAAKGGDVAIFRAEIVGEITGDLPMHVRTHQGELIVEADTDPLLGDQMKGGDKLLTIAGMTLWNKPNYDYLKVWRAQTLHKPLVVKVIRDGKELELKMVPH